MGLFDLFFDKDKRQQVKLEKAIARLTNPYMQGQERMRGADILLEIGSEEAICGLLKRFTIRASNGVVDEEEKEQIYGMIIGLGERAIPPLKKFLLREDQTYHALRALSELLPVDEVVQVIEDSLKTFGTDYMRNPERKLHLIQHLAEASHPRAAEVLVPFLEDHDENVRFQTVNALKEQGSEQARVPLLERLCNDEEESLRLRKRIIEVLHEMGWEVKGFRKRVEERLPKGYVVDRSGLIKERGAKIEPALTGADGDDDD